MRTAIERRDRWRWSAAMAAATSLQIAGSNRKTNAVPPSVAPVDQISGPDVTSSTLRKPRPLLPTLLFGSFGLWPSWQSP